MENDRLTNVLCHFSSAFKTINRRELSSPSSCVSSFVSNRWCPDFHCSAGVQPAKSRQDGGVAPKLDHYRQVGVGQFEAVALDFDRAVLQEIVPGLVLGAESKNKVWSTMCAEAGPPAQREPLILWLTRVLTACLMDGSRDKKSDIPSGSINRETLRLFLRAHTGSRRRQ